VLSAAMSGDEVEKGDQAALPWRQHSNAEAPQVRRQSRGGARRILRRPQDSEPGEHVGFGIVRRVAVPESGLDQAARINPVATVMGAWIGALPV
jgi:hypothetical protein